MRGSAWIFHYRVTFNVWALYEHTQLPISWSTRHGLCAVHCKSLTRTVMIVFICLMNWLAERPGRAEVRCESLLMLFWVGMLPMKKILTSLAKPHGSSRDCFSTSTENVVNSSNTSRPSYHPF